MDQDLDATSLPPDPSAATTSAEEKTSEENLLSSTKRTDGKATQMTSSDSDIVTVEQGLSASFYSQGKAIECLITGGIPEAVEDASSSDISGQEGALANIDTPASTPAESMSKYDLLAVLRAEPQFQQIRQVIHRNPQLLNAVLQQIGQTNHALLQFILENEEQFIETLNEPAEDETASFSKLSHGVVHIILNNLDFLDLYNAQFIDDKCKTVAQSKDLWEKFEFKISKMIDLPTVEQMLLNLPKLQKLSTCGKYSIPRSFLNILFNTKENIIKLNCSFSPPITYQHVQLIVEKYRNLESVQVECSDINILQSVKLLLGLNFLRCIFLTKLITTSVWNVPLQLLTTYRDVCMVLKQFPIIHRLNISGLYLESDNLNDVFCEVLSRRHLELKALTATFRNNEVLLNEILQCVNLLELNLTICFRSQENFSTNICDIETLQLLTVVFQYRNHPINLINHLGVFIRRFIDTNFYQNSFLNLQFLKLSAKFAQVNAKTALTKIIASCPRLKVLKLKVEMYTTISEEMDELERLTMLEQFSLSCWNRLSLAAIQSISLCTTLKILKLNRCVVFTSGDSKRQLRRVQEVVALVRTLSNLKKLIFKESRFDNMEANLKTTVTTECEARNDNLVIINDD